MNDKSMTERDTMERTKTGRLYDKRRDLLLKGTKKLFIIKAFKFYPTVDFRVNHKKKIQTLNGYIFVNSREN